MVENLPHQQQGVHMLLSVRLTADHHPASGVEVYWDDGRTPTRVSAKRSTSDSSGLAQIVWSPPLLAPNVPWTTYSVQAAVPGAAGNPIVYTMQVFRCTRC